MQTLVSLINRALNRNVQKGAIALALAATTLGACNSYEEPVAEDPTVDSDMTEEVAQDPIEAAEEQNVEVGDLTGNVEDYIGQTVSVRGEAEAAVGEIAFLLQDDQLFGGDEVIVFNATTEPFLLPDDEPTENVQVTGEVRQLVIAELETEYGLDLDPELYADYEDRPAIIAQSIAFAPDPEELSEEPEGYYYRRISVTGEIGEMLSNSTFTLQEEQLLGGEQILVIGDMLSPMVEGEEEVIVTGVLRPYIAAEFERDYDLNWDLDFQEQIEAEYSEKPVLVAEEVYPSAE